MSQLDKGLDEELDFEETMRRLEQCVASLEGQGLSLEDSLRTFAEAVQWIQTCQGYLDQAEQRIHELMPQSSGSSTAASTEPPQENQAE